MGAVGHGVLVRVAVVAGGQGAVDDGADLADAERGG